MITILKKSRIFFKFLFSYIAILLIPLLVMSFIIYNNYIKILRNEVVNSNVSMLNQIKSTIDSDVQELKRISVQIAMNPNLTPHMISRNPFHTMNGVRELKNYSVTNSCIEELALYIRGGEYLYSATSTYTISTFINDIYNYESWDEIKFYQDINKITTPTYRSAENVLHNHSYDIRVITFIHPIPKGTMYPYGTVLFLINERSFKTKLNNLLNNRNGNTLILNEKGEIMTSQRGYIGIDISKLLELMDLNKNQHTHTTSIDNINYFVSYVKSEETGWTYLTYLPVYDVMKKVTDIKIMTFYGFVLIFVVGSIVIYYVMHLNYDPIKQLRSFAENKWGKTAGCHNELEAIRTAINKMSETSHELSMKIQNSHTALKEHLLLGLLKGQIRDINEFNSMGKDLGVCFTKPFYLVAFLSLGNLSNINNLNKNIIIKDLEENIPPDLEGYGKDSIDNEHIVFIFSTDEKCNRKLQEKLHQMRKRIKDKWGLSTTVGVGNCYKSLEYIGRSYIEACTSIDYKLIRGINQVIFYNEIVSMDHETKWYPKDALERLEKSLRLGYTEEIEETVIDIIKIIKEKNIPLFLAKCLCFDIVNTVIRVMHELNIEFGSVKNEYPDVISLSEFESTDELKDIIRRICFNLSNLVKENKESHNFDLRDRMLKYIEENYDSYSFSVKAMASHFGISPSYMSRYFKDQMGQTILEYVHILRMKKAKKLLKTSNETLCNIVTQIGYCDTSSFIKKFKQLEGVTPGEYRNMIKES